MEKKKVEQYIIPPTYYRNPTFSITEVKAPVEKKEAPLATHNSTPDTQKPETEAPEKVAEAKPVIPNITKPGVSAFSLSSIRKKKELEAANKSYVKPTTHLPTEDFTETEMLLQWNKYAQRLGEKGFKIMESLLLINDPVLNGTSISIELPNEGSKLDFEKELNGLLGHLRGHLHNHDITINIIVNESFEFKRSLNDQDRYNRLLEINPNIELLRTTFGLDLHT
ncbi:DNA polymerase III subunit gamma/tau [Flavobacterium sp. 140616W15]|uniref:DNA polymerase III subunit gamma/tau n=1 Tax=Flavobacterium sp. 140616W15 TaxID=2478552 RepID=UPI001F5D2369|nr:DNA polymerase III subunit gamma/tau [Flavobacterium sp. 140616W15]